MTYKTLKAKYQGHNSKVIPVQIIEDNKVVHTFEVFGNKQTAKKRAEQYIKETTTKE